MKNYLIILLLQIVVGLCLSLDARASKLCTKKLFNSSVSNSNSGYGTRKFTCDEAEEFAKNAVIALCYLNGHKTCFIEATKEMKYRTQYTSGRYWTTCTMAAIARPVDLDDCIPDINVF